MLLDGFVIIKKSLLIQLDVPYVTKLLEFLTDVGLTVPGNTTAGKSIYPAHYNFTVYFYTVIP